jgi:type II secretory pathway pseudopilin PulG
MGTRISPGFTIIETMLFLAVTGLLVLGVLIGTGSALNVQRYRDSVESFKGLLQEQYADLGSVRNSRDNDWSCDSTATPTPGGGIIRGQSDCLIIGKYMRIQGGAITVYPVLAHTTGPTSGLADVTALDTRYAFHVSPTERENLSMEWGTQIAWPRVGAGARAPTTPRSMAILIVRSPESGSIYTFTSDNAPSEADMNQNTFTDMIVAGSSIPGQGSRTICVLSSGLFPSGDRAVYLNAYAATTSAVEVRSNDFSRGSGGTTEC